jgi:hypothetical protein
VLGQMARSFTNVRPGRALLQGYISVACRSEERSFRCESIAGQATGTRISAAHWTKTGMPVRREGRHTVAEASEIRNWLVREAHMPAPAEVPRPGIDIAVALKESLSAFHHRKHSPHS